MWVVIKANKKSHIEILKDNIKKDFLQCNFISQKLRLMKKTIKKNLFCTR